MATLQVSFRCVENTTREIEGREICTALSVFEDVYEIDKPLDLTAKKKDVMRRAAERMTPSATLTTYEYLVKQIRKRLKEQSMPRRIIDAKIVIVFMWDEYALAENGSLC